MNALDLVSTIGSTTGSFAKRIGSGAADLALTTGKGSAKLAKTIGPKRSIVGIATVGALIAGGIVLAKFLKRRALEAESMAASDKASGVGKKIANGVNRRVRKVKEAVTEPATY
ncbi:MAG TPA: hypothetical protein VGM39_26230 [Kofleriaceae bacterium]|jgi:hypothetical protein